MKYTVRHLFILIISILLISCGDNQGSGSSGNSPGPNPTNATEINLGNITTIPLGGNSGNTSIVVTNNLNHDLVLQSATYTLYTGIDPTVLPTDNPNSPVNATQCSTLEARGTCNVQVKAPVSSGSGQYLLTMKFLDGTTGKTHTTSQIISYSDLIPATVTGVKYSTQNTNVYNEANGSTTISVPFVLTKSFASLTATSDRENPAFAPSISCPGNSYTAGNLCTLYVTISHTGNNPLILGGISVFGELAQSRVKSRLSSAKSGLNPNKTNTLQGQTGYLFGVPITVTQNVTGNLITSGVNVVINPSDGNTANAQTITLLNNGTATINNILVNGINPAAISNNGCSSLVAGASCTFKVNVNSTTSGQSSVVVTYDNGSTSGNSSGSLSFNVIYISAVPGPAMTMTSGQGNLNSVPINTTQYYNILVSNTGNVTLSNITFNNPTNVDPAFSWDSSSTCAADGSQSLPSGAKCTLVLKYSPTVVTPSSTLTIRETATWLDQGGNQQTYANASLSVSYSAVNGDAFIYISPNYVSFAIRADGHDSVAQTFTVRNSGLQAATVNTITIPAVTAFSQTGGTCVAGTTVLNVGQSCTIVTQYGTTLTTMTNVTAQLTVGYKPNANYTTDVTTFSDLVFNSSPAAYIAVSNIVVTNTTTGTGISSSPYQFTNSPVAGTQINFVITYTNTGPAAATNFNVALNSLPVGYVVAPASTTCGYGANTTTLAAATGTCDVAFQAVDPAGLYNPYSLSGPLNVNIPGYSYVDANTGLNTMQFPVWTGNYGNSNKIFVTANLLAAITTTTPTWTTANAGGTNNFTFSGTPNGTVITIPAGQLSGFTVGSSRTCTIASGSCNIPITNPSGFPTGTVYFSYVVSPAGNPNGITQQASFILN